MKRTGIKFQRVLLDHYSSSDGSHNRLSEHHGILGHGQFANIPDFGTIGHRHEFRHIIHARHGEQKTIVSRLDFLKHERTVDIGHHIAGSCRIGHRHKLDGNTGQAFAILIKHCAAHSGRHRSDSGQRGNAEHPGPKQ